VELNWSAGSIDLVGQPRVSSEQLGAVPCAAELDPAVQTGLVVWKGPVTSHRCDRGELTVGRRLLRLRLIACWMYPSRFQCSCVSSLSGQTFLN